MNFEYFLLLITLQSIVCYTTKRETPVSSNLKHLKSKPVPVTPARYQVVSKTTYDPVNTDYFPAVEHPSSVIDASKPFYVSSSPFSDEVTTLFKSLSDRNNNAKPTIDYSWKPKEVLKEKAKEVLKTDNKDVSNKEPVGLKTEDNVMNNELPSNHADQDTNSSTTTECDDIAYVIELINDLDEFMKNITDLEEECKENNNGNTTVNTYESDKPNELTTGSSVVTSNDTVFEFNGNSFSIDDSQQIQAPLLEETDASLNSTSIPDHGVTNSNSVHVVDEKDTNVCRIEKIFDETNSTCDS